MVESKIKKKHNLNLLIGIFFLIFSSSLVLAETGEDINASSTNYFIKSFALGLQAHWNSWQNTFSTFLSFNDGMTGNVESVSYTANIGPIGKYTDYQQCFRTTCSSLGYSCGIWDDNCGGFLNCGACETNYVCYLGNCILEVTNNSTTSKQLGGSTSSSISGKFCLTNWTCSNWSSCIDGIQTRVCTKKETYCYADLKNKPVEIQNCSMEESKGNNGIDSANEVNQKANNSSELESTKSNRNLVLWIVVAFIISIILFFIFYKRLKK